MNKLKLLSMLGVASFGVSVATAQVTINEPGPVTFGGLLDSGDPDNTFRPAYATTASGFTMGTSVTISAAAITAVNTLTWRREAAVRLQNSAFPSLNAFFRFSNLTGTYTSFTISTPTTQLYGIENFEDSEAPNDRPSDLPGANIPAGSTWDITYYETFDDGAGADSSGSGINFTINGFVPPVYTFTAAGPIPSKVGTVQAPANANVSGPVVASSFVLARDLGATSTYTRVVAGDWPSDTVLVIRNSAAPNSFATAIIAPLNSTVASQTFANVAAQMSGPLVFSSIPAGSTFSFEFFNLFQEVGSSVGNTEANFTDIDLRMISTTAASAPSATNLGVLGTSTTVTTSVVSGTNLTWYQFSLANPVNFFAGSFLDIFTGGVADDTEVSLYNANGGLIATDDDDDTASFSALSFGAGTRPANPGGASFNGRDGFALPAGTYFLAVGEYDMSSADRFAVTTSGLGFIDPVILTLRTGVTAQQVTLPLNFVGAIDPFVVNRTMRYSVMQGTTTIVSSTNFTASSATQNVVISIPASATGAVTIEIDGAQYLKRKVSATLTGSAQTLSSATIRPGDVDNSTEVDLTDIDLIIGDYLGTGGTTEGTITDLDNSGEVDLTDIDIAIGNYLLADD